jgi:hypothetical protein
LTGRDHIEPVVPDITAVRRDDDLVNALSTRDGLARAEDEAILLLRALTVDVDLGAPPLPVARRPEREASPAGPVRRRRARVVVSLGLTATLLTTTGVAAASGGMSDVVARFASPPAADRPYHDFRADLRHAQKAVESRQYDTARASLDKARNRRPALRGSEATDVDKEIDKLESRLPHTPPPFPRQWPLPSASLAGDPGDLQRAAGSAAEQRLRDAQSAVGRTSSGSPTVDLP